MRVVLKVLIAIPLLVLAAYGAWKAFGGRDGERLGDLREALLERAIRPAARAIADAPPSRLYVLPLRGDGGGVVRARLEREIARQGRARVVDRATLAEELKERAPGILAAIAGRVLGGDPERPLARDEALAFARDAGLEAIVLGEVRLEEGPERVVLDGRIDALDVASGRDLAARELRDEIAKTLADPVYLRHRIASVALGWRLLAWMLFAAGLPWMLWGPVRRVLASEKNLRNAALLLALTAADAALFWFVLGFPATTIGAIAVALVGIGFAGGYNYLALSEMEDLRR